MNQRLRDRDAKEIDMNKANSTVNNETGIVMELRTGTEVEPATNRISEIQIPEKNNLYLQKRNNIVIRPEILNNWKNIRPD